MIQSKEKMFIKRKKKTCFFSTIACLFQNKNSPCNMSWKRTHTLKKIKRLFVKV